MIIEYNCLVSKYNVFLASNDDNIWATAMLLSECKIIIGILCWAYSLNLHHYDAFIYIYNNIIYLYNHIPK